VPPDAAAEILSDRKDGEVRASGQLVRLTNLKKVYWPEDGITKGDL
jgi:hypothetical protein